MSAHALDNSSDLYIINGGRERRTKEGSEGGREGGREVGEKEKRRGKQNIILFNYNRTLQNLTEVRSVATFRLSQQLEFIAIMKQP